RADPDDAGECFRLLHGGVEGTGDHNPLTHMVLTEGGKAEAVRGDVFGLGQLNLPEVIAHADGKPRLLAVPFAPVDDPRRTVAGNTACRQWTGMRSHLIVLRGISPRRG